jgi:hypothetical protein
MTGANVQLGKNETFYNMIMARNFANECVHLVYIPASQVVYHAYDYDENGMGVSLLDGVTQTSTLRIMTNFANFMASVNNAVGAPRSASTSTRVVRPGERLHGADGRVSAYRQVQPLPM